MLTLVATDAPDYGGATRDGNTYTVNFTAPDNGDVTQVRVFSSPDPNFTADEKYPGSRSGCYAW